MATLLTFFLVVALVAYFAIRNRIARRRAARTALEDRRRREAAEREIGERLRRLKEKNDLAAAAGAIGDDPGRAARVVGRMMRKD